MAFHELAEEPFGRTGIAVLLNQDVDHVSILIHSPPYIVPLPLDVHEELIQVPDVPQPSLLTPELLGVVWTELPPPLPDGLVGDRDSSLRQEFLNVPEAQTAMSRGEGAYAGCSTQRR